MWLSILRFRVGLEGRSGGPRRTETLGRRGGPCVRAGNQSGQALRTAPAFPHGSPPGRSLRTPLGDVDLESGTIGIANTRTMMGNETVVGKILSRWPDSASFPCQFRSGTSSGRSSLSRPRKSWSSDLATLTPATSWWTRWGRLGTSSNSAGEHTGSWRFWGYAKCACTTPGRPVSHTSPTWVFRTTCWLGGRETRTSGPPRGATSRRV